MNAAPDTTPVLLYDGVCGFCNRGVRTILRFDRKCTLRFAALDSEFAVGVIARHPELAHVDSVIFVADPGQPQESVAVRSEAVFRISNYLGGRWRLLAAVRIIPAPLRDSIYDRFAKVRYRVFGKYDTCPLPPPELRARFIND